MTVKEAIERLKYDREMCYFNPDTGESGEPYDEECREMAQALDIAIEALKNESGDYNWISNSKGDTGEWIPVRSYWFKCSECDAHREMKSGFLENFCPCCGSKMRQGSIEILRSGSE